ncbi:MAG: MFS transporter [Pseudomonadota bacterium]
MPRARILRIARITSHWTRLPGAVWLLGVASLLNDVSSEMVFPLLGGFIATLGAPMRTVGVVLGVADAAAVVVKILVGRWSDKVSRRPLVIAGYLVAAAGRAAIALSTTAGQVLGARSLDRAGRAVRSGPRDAMLAAVVPAGERGRAYGLNQALDHVGAAVGPLLASACLVGGLSMRATFGIAAAVGLLAPLLLALRLRDEPRAARPPQPLVPITPALAAGDAAPAGGGAKHPGWAPLGTYLFTCGVFALGNSSDAFILLRAGQLGWAPALLPLLWLAHHLVTSVTSAIGGSLSDRLPRAWMIGGGWAAYAATYLGFAFAAERWHVLALLLFYGVYHGLAEAPERALVADLAVPARRGTAFGLYHGVVGFAALPAGLFMGWLWDRAGARAAFAGGAALALLAAVLLGALVFFGPLKSAGHAPSRGP